MKKCPYCAEEIQPEAVVCKHCGRDLKDGAQQVQIVQPKAKAKTSGCVVLIVLLGGWWFFTSLNLGRARDDTTKARGAQARTAFEAERVQIAADLTLLEQQAQAGNEGAAAATLVRLGRTLDGLLLVPDQTQEMKSAIARRDAARKTINAKTSKRVAENEAEKDRADMRRLFLSNSKWDDSARAYILQTLIKSTGERCDSVTSALMGQPGRWTVRCAPGYLYQVVCDKNGKPTHAGRLR